VVKRVARNELQNESWLHSVARLTGRSCEALRVSILDFLETDVFNVSVENCESLLDPLVESWDLDLVTFSMEIVLNPRLLPGHAKRFEFVESESVSPGEEPGLTKFLRHLSVNGDATEEEINFLKKLKIKGKHPTLLYYYRELQNLRDPLHFSELTTQPTPKKTLRQQQPEGSVASMHQYLEADGIERKLQLNSRKKATQQRAGNRGMKQKAGS